MKLLSWNIRQGGGTRCAGILDAIQSVEPDFLVLSEFRNNKHGVTLQAGLERDGFSTQRAADSQGNENGVLVAARDGNLTTDIFPDADPKFAHSIARISTPAFDLYGLYLPHKKKHTLFPYLRDHLDGAPPSILAGDFNTGVNFVDQKGKTFWYTHELKALEHQGYVDAFRHLHPDAREYSWFSHGGNGFRYDHTWLQRDLVDQIKTCSYLHEHRESKLSDHSPMLLEM